MSSLGWLAQPAAFPWVALVVGLCVGSFLNVVVHRLPRIMEREWLGQVPEMLEEAEALSGEPDRARVAHEVRGLTRAALAERLSLSFPRSRCPACGDRIGALQNIPLLSYLALRGRCARCKARISPGYPMVELIAGVGAFYCAYHFGFGLQALAAAVFFWCVIALALIDHKTGYLPDDITLPLMWLGLLVNLAGTFVPLADAVIGAVAGYMVLWTVNAVFRALRGVEGMGYGDFKMTAAVAAFLGWRELFMVILLSSLVGLVFGSAQMFAARRGWDWKFKFHFGPSIAIAGVIALFWGHEIARRVPMLRPLG
jgi:leader peptidase (prepilin peptidase) / N-methyltransferase